VNTPARSAWGPRKAAALRTAASPDTQLIFFILSYSNRLLNQCLCSLLFFQARWYLQRTHKSFGLQNREYSFLWSVNLCINFASPWFLKGSYFTQARFTLVMFKIYSEWCQRPPPSSVPFPSKGTVGRVSRGWPFSEGSPGLCVPCGSGPRLHAPVVVSLCCAILASRFSEPPKCLSDSGGGFSLFSTNGRSLTLVKFVKEDLVLVNKWMGGIFPANPIEIHFILQFPQGSIFKHFKSNVCFGMSCLSWKSRDWCFLEFPRYMRKEVGCVGGIFAFSI